MRPRIQRPGRAAPHHGRRTSARFHPHGFSARARKTTPRWGLARPTRRAAFRPLQRLNVPVPSHLHGRPALKRRNHFPDRVPGEGRGRWGRSCAAGTAGKGSAANSDDRHPSDALRTRRDTRDLVGGVGRSRSGAPPSLAREFGAREWKMTWLGRTVRAA